jgi:hypothetical protein
MDKRGKNVGINRQYRGKRLVPNNSTTPLSTNSQGYYGGA